MKYYIKRYCGCSKAQHCKIVDKLWPCWFIWSATKRLRPSRRYCAKHRTVGQSLGLVWRFTRGTIRKWVKYKINEEKILKNLIITKNAFLRKLIDVADRPNTYKLTFKKKCFKFISLLLLLLLLSLNNLLLGQNVLLLLWLLSLHVPLVRGHGHVHEAACQAVKLHHQLLTIDRVTDATGHRRGD